jgi:hypothetical protein
MSVGFTDRSGVPDPVAEDPWKRVAIDCQFVRGTAAAVLVRDGAGVEAWLSRKHIIIDDRLGSLHITMPAWLARDKGLHAEAGAGQRTLF